MLFLLACQLSSLPALAQEAREGDLAEEADLHFELAGAAYARRDYADALQHLLLSNRLAPNRNVVYNIARTYERLGDYDSAYRHYADYIGMESDPELRSEAQASLARIAREVALVEITSDPPGATIFIDRAELGARGQTPLVLALPPGPHEVILSMDGHVGDKASTTLSVGARAAVSLRLEPILGQVALSGGPEGAQVFLEDDATQPVGVLPGSLSLPPGQHVLVIRAEGHEPVRELVTVVADQTSRLEVSLPVRTGTLVVDAVERNAVIRLDGEPVGFTPAVLDVPVGAHTIEIEKAGFRSITEEVVVEADARQTLNLRLRSQQELSAASRSMQRAEDAPASVSVITGAEIRAFGYQEVYDAVSGTRSLFNSNDLSYQYLGVRGFGRPGDYGNRLLVTVDGHTLNDDQIGASYVGSDLMVDLEDVEQIEIVRGPGSALYGSNAFFGVINVVTKEGEGSPGHAVLTADSGRSARARVGTNVGDADRGAWLSAGGMLSQGRDYYFEEYAEDGPEAGWVRGADGARSASLAAKAWAGNFKAQAFYTGRDKRFATGAFETIPGDPRASNTDQRAFAELRVDATPTEAAAISARAFVDHYRYSGDFPYEDEGVYEDDWVGTWAGVEPRFTLRPLRPLALTVGAEGRYYFQAALTSAAPGDVFLEENPTQAVVSAYAVADAELGSWLRVSLGGRYDWFSIADVGGSFNPRAALIFQPDDVNVLKLLGGTAFRAPSPYELYYTDGGLTQIRPDALDPERVAAGELEYTRRFSEVVSATGSVWGNRITGLVDTDVKEQDGEELLQYVNTDARVYATGVDLELRRDWQLGSMLAVQGTLQSTTEGAPLTGERLTNYPSALFSIKGATPTPLPGALIASRLVVESPRLTTQDNWTPWALIWDLNLTGELPEAPVSWGLGVRNLLDWQVMHPGGYDLLQDAVPQPGRSVYARVRVEI